MSNASLDRLLSAAAEFDASDLHLVAGVPAAFRVNGEIIIADDDALSESEVEEIAYSLLNEQQRKKFDTEWELCISLLHSAAGRVRATFYRRNGHPEMSLRFCGERIASREELGLPERIDDLARKPNGLVLVTGPTGAGKTTTLYSALNELNVITDKIITTEDPVEYEIDGIVQCPINHDIDLTFASALRSILRQDPDIILVGEIRDLETAQIAVQASLTGHMVFSTLHTNDAPTSITRLRDMGVEPFLITATLEGILAQRLVRKICVNCREEFTPSAEMLMELGLKPGEMKTRKFYYGAGCEKCNNLGFRGRVGLFELMLMDDEIRDLISAGGSTDALRNHVRSRGVPGLREAGLKALANGVTTIEEVVRETVLESEGG